MVLFGTECRCQVGDKKLPRAALTHQDHLGTVPFAGRSGCRSRFPQSPAFVDGERGVFAECVRDQ